MTEDQAATKIQAQFRGCVFNVLLICIHVPLVTSYCTSHRDCTGLLQCLLIN